MKVVTMQDGLLSVRERALFIHGREICDGDFMTEDILSRSNNVKIIF